MEGRHEMKLIFSEVEYEILARTVKGPIEQAALVDALIPMTGPNYCYLRIRALAARGHITKEISGKKTLLTITPAGRKALAMMDSDEAGI